MRKQSRPNSIQDFSNLPELPAEIEKEAEKRHPNTWKPQTREQINQFFADNIKLIHELLKQYKGLDEYDDLFQEASLGFYKGIISYDPSKGTKLTTYAYECARNQVKMHLRKIQAKFRTATIISLDFRSEDKESSEQDSLLNQRQSEHDSLHPWLLNMEDTICQNDLIDRILDVVDSEMTYEQQVVIHRMMQGVPQSETAKELNSSQANVSKCLKYALCELHLKLLNYGIIDEDTANDY